VLSQPLDLSKIDTCALFDYLYDFFKRDFVTNKTYLNRCIYINPQTGRKDNGKEASFWHIISREKKIKIRDGNRYVWKAMGRAYDVHRSERIEWVKQIIDSHDDDKVKFFYHKETTGRRPIRLYLWAHEDDFVVILQKLGRTSSFLVTSFYIDHAGKRRDYQKRLTAYQNKNLVELALCEWF